MPLPDFQVCRLRLDPVQGYSLCRQRILSFNFAGMSISSSSRQVSDVATGIPKIGDSELVSGVAGFELGNSSL